jgi:hypothetical protein
MALSCFSFMRKKKLGEYYYGTHSSQQTLYLVVYSNLLDLRILHNNTICLTGLLANKRLAFIHS